MNEQHETYIGIDLHTNNFTCCFINADESRYKQRFSLEKESLQQFYEQLNSRTSVLLEATSNSFEFSDLLKDKVKNVIIGNTHKLKLISFVNQKTDKIDTEKLAKYLKMQMKGGEDLVSPVYVPESAIRELRSLFTDTKKEMLQELPLPASASSLFEIRLLLSEVDRLKEYKKQLEKQIKRAGAPYIHEIDILTSMSGVSVLMALAIISDTADVHRFKNAKKFTSYLRSTPSVCSSNETTVKKGTSKSVRKLSVTSLTQSYVHFKKCNKRIKRWIDTHADNKPPSVMRMAVLRNVLAEIYHMLSNNEHHWYRDETLHSRKLHEYQCATVEFFVVRNNNLCIRITPTKNYMATMLSLEYKPSSFKYLDALFSGNSRKSTHTTTIIESNCSTGIGRWSSSRVRMYPSIASLIFSIATSFVFPWLIQPGRLGHSAIKYPSSPG